MYRAYDHKHRLYGAPDRWMLFSDIQTLNALSITFRIYVHHIVVNDDEVLYERPLTAKPCHIRWELDKEMVESLEASHTNKRYISPLYGGMFALALKRTSPAFISLKLVLCALPKGKRSVKLSWTMELIATGPEDFKQTNNCSLTKALTMEGLGSKSHGSGKFLAVADLQKSDALIFSVDINVHNDGDDEHAHPAIEHWNQVTEPDTCTSPMANASAVEKRIDSLQSSVSELATKMEMMHTSIDRKLMKLMKIITKMNAVPGSGGV